LAEKGLREAFTILRDIHHHEAHRISARLAAAGEGVERHDEIVESAPRQTCDERAHGQIPSKHARSLPRISWA